MTAKKDKEIKETEKNSQDGQEQEYQCNECNAFFKDKSSLGGHIKNFHKKEGKQGDSGEVNMGDTQEAIFKRHLKNGGVMPGLADLIADVYFGGNSNDLVILNKIMTKAGVQPNRRGMIIEAWANSQGIVMPEELGPIVEQSKTEKTAEKIGKDGDDDSMFDTSEIRKQLKTQLEFENYKMLLDYFRQPRQTGTTFTGPTKTPVLDPSTGQVKVVETSGGMDPNMLMMMNMMQMQQQSAQQAAQNMQTLMLALVQNKSGGLTDELMKYQEFRKATFQNDGSGDKLNELRLEMVKNNSEKEKLLIEERAKMQNWMAEFKNALEKSKMEVEMNAKIDRLQDMIKDAQNRGDLTSELSKYNDLKGVLVKFAESEGMKKGETGGGGMGINWQEMIGKGFDAINNYLSVQSQMINQQPPQMVEVRDIPSGPMPSDQELRDRLVREQNDSYPDFSHNYVGVEWKPEMGLKRPDEQNSNVGRNEYSGNSKGPPGSNEQK